MEVINWSWKLVKPSNPTPTTLRFFNISFTDELAPTINVPLILYYPPPPPPPPPSPPPTLLRTIISDRLEDSLSETLTQFYPLAGRYIRKLSMVDCNDQGVLYVRGKADVRLSEIPRTQPDLLNKLLAFEIESEADEPDVDLDPMLSIKVTTFECGGFAVGMCFSHKISDMGTICTFINNWASKTNDLDDEHGLNYTPVFNSASFFPSRGLPELDLSVVGVKIAARRFHFTSEAIAAMSECVRFDENGLHGHCRKPSKVQLVVALLWKAFMRVDQANDGKPKASFLIQAVGIRDKVVPRLPANSCGNFWGLATCQLGPGKGDNDNDNDNDISFQDIVKNLSESVKKTIKDCAKILTHGEEGNGIVINPYLESNRKIADDDVNVYLFTCWCKFSFYKANFGYGEPIWTSTGKLPTQNLVIMLDDDEGNGVEAWVHLDEKRMKELEQDSDIKTYGFN